MLAADPKKFTLLVAELSDNFTGRYGRAESHKKDFAIVTDRSFFCCVMRRDVRRGKNREGHRSLPVRHIIS